jgi:DNA polymerase-3 subunit alpha
MVALYRPGPLAFIPDYIERKHNPEKVVYFDPKLKIYLEQTYGILIYQDDILLIAVNLAGYSWGEADKFRKAVGKKIPEEMKKQKSKPIEQPEFLGNNLIFKSNPNKDKSNILINNKGIFWGF